LIWVFSASSLEIRRMSLKRTVFYEVEVDYTSDNTKIVWTLNGETHCEHGPAIWWQDGTHDFYLRGKQNLQKLEFGNKEVNEKEGEG
jgi:hypothetical protein